MKVKLSIHKHWEWVKQMKIKHIHSKWANLQLVLKPACITPRQVRVRPNECFISYDTVFIKICLSGTLLSHPFKEPKATYMVSYSSILSSEQLGGGCFKLRESIWLKVTQKGGIWAWASLVQYSDHYITQALFLLFCRCSQIGKILQVTCQNTWGKCIFLNPTLKCCLWFLIVLLS